MFYKEDWDEAKRIFEDWWEGRLDRPLIQILSPKDDWIPNIDSWAFLRFHPNVDKSLDRLFHQFSKISFEKEAYPNVWVNLGPGSLSAYLGAELRFNEQINTSWFLGDFSLSALENVDFNPSNEWWKYTCQAYEVASKRCRDRAVVAFTDLLDAVTVTGQLRGNFPTNLLRDMFCDGRRLKKVLERVHGLFLRHYDESCKLIDVSENGYSTWAGIWSKEKHFVLQCDMIVYLSPRLFREFVHPLIVEECRYFDKTIWHLDGPLELNHLDDLLNIPELDCIQWIPGAGNPDGGEDCWTPLYRKIHAKGKLIQLIVPPEKVMHLINRISSKGVAIRTTCRTRDETRKLIDEIGTKYG